MPVTGPAVKRYLAPALAFVLPFTLYFLTTARDIFWLDSAEFINCTAINGLAHPPGYPLLLLFTRVAALVPLPSFAFRINLLGALFAALSCLVIFLLIAPLPRARTAALLGALIWAVSWELWQQATVIEVYSLQVLLTGLALLAAAGYAETGSARMLLLLTFVLGLGFANHLFTLFWLPGITVIVYIQVRHRLKWQTGLAALLLFALGPLLYLTLLFRSQKPPSWGEINGPKALFEYVTARIYRYRFFAGGSGYLATQFRDLPKILLQQFTIFWPLVIPGIIYLTKSRRWLLSGIITGILFSGPAALLYNIPDKEGYFLPVYFACALIIGCGIFYLRRVRRLFIAMISGLLIIVAFYYYPKQDRSKLTSLSDLGSAVLSELPEGAIVFTDDYSLFQALHWLTLGTTGHRNITVISQYHLALPWYLHRLSRTLPVPTEAFTLTAELWHNPVRTSDSRFGETARTRTEEIMEILISGLLPAPVFYFPQNFTRLLENWHHFRLKLHGLTYQFCPGSDTLTDPDFPLKFPGPEKYCATRFYDPYTVDLCRRFAATVNRRGMLKYARGDVRGALQDFNLSLKYYPDYSAAIENKGIVFYFEKMPDSARLYLNRFLKLEPHSPETEKVQLLLHHLAP